MNKVVDAVSLTLSLVCFGVSPEGIEKWITLGVSVLNLIVFLVFKILTWKKKAMEDGKITADEVTELAQDINDGLAKSNAIPDNNGKEEIQDEREHPKDS